MRTTNIILAIAICVMVASCGPGPIPQEKAAFVGQWKAASGVMLDIHANGTATLQQAIDHTHPDWERLCIKVGPPTITEISASFIADTVLQIAKPLQYAKTYSIDRAPSMDGDTMKMVLNGVVLTKREIGN